MAKKQKTEIPKARMRRKKMLFASFGIVLIVLGSMSGLLAFLLSRKTQIGNGDLNSYFNGPVLAQPLTTDLDEAFANEEANANNQFIKWRVPYNKQKTAFIDTQGANVFKTVQGNFLLDLEENPDGPGWTALKDMLADKGANLKYVTASGIVVSYKNYQNLVVTLLPRLLSSNYDQDLAGEHDAWGQVQLSIPNNNFGAITFKSRYLLTLVARTPDDGNIIPLSNNYVYNYQNPHVYNLLSIIPLIKNLSFFKPSQPKSPTDHWKPLLAEDIFKTFYTYSSNIRAIGGNLSLWLPEPAEIAYNNQALNFKTDLNQNLIKLQPLTKIAGVSRINYFNQILTNLSASYQPLTFKGAFTGTPSDNYSGYVPGRKSETDNKANWKSKKSQFSGYIDTSFLGSPVFQRKTINYTQESYANQNKSIFIPPDVSSAIKAELLTLINKVTATTNPSQAAFQATSASIKKQVQTWINTNPVLTNNLTQIIITGMNLANLIKYPGSWKVTPQATSCSYQRLISVNLTIRVTLNFKDTALSAATIAADRNFFTSPITKGRPFHIDPKTGKRVYDDCPTNPQQNPKKALFIY